MSNIYQMYYAVAMNHYLSKKNDPEANQWAECARQAFRRDSMLCAAYNTDIAAGKWNGMMTQKHIGYRSWNDNFPADRLPALQAVKEGSGGYVFTMENNYVSMEAEHYYEAQSAANAQWTVLPFVGRTLSGMTLMPYTESVTGASLSYRFTTTPQMTKRPNDQTTTTTVKVHVIVKSTLDYLNKGGLTYTVSLDGSEAQRVNFNHNLNEAKENIYSIFYPTVARRIVESVVTLPFDETKQDHVLTLSPDDPAIVFEKVVVDAGGYQSQFLFGEESPKTR
jgi:hypothetical protein